MPLTTDQVMLAEKIVIGTANLRKTITLYKKTDKRLAVFRVHAFKHIQSAIIAKVTCKRLPPKTRKWLEGWEFDQGIGRNIIELFRSIDEDY